MRINKFGNAVERVGMALLGVAAGLYVLVIVLTAGFDASAWLWLLPNGVGLLGLLVLMGKVLYDRFTDEENTKYGNVD